MGKGAGEEPYDGRGHTYYALLAYPYSYSAENVYAASIDDLRRDTGTHSEGVGSVLHYERDLEEVFLHFDVAGSRGVLAAFQAISANVCGDRNFDGQRPAEKGEDLGSLDCPPDAQDVPRGADAGADVPGLGTSGKNSIRPDTARCTGPGRVWV
jgi:hypothetical protein